MSILSWLQTKARNLLLKILAAGPVPRHVAFIMDGNRRYARMNGAAIKQGHADGFMALRKMLEVCFRLNVHCVSAYAFAIENFKRSEEEVDALMNLAEEKLVEISQHGDLLNQYGVRLNIVGRKELLPPSVQAAIAQAEGMTKDNNRSILNICMPYASRDEITTAVESCAQNAADAYIEDGKPISISEKDIDDQLMTTLGGSPPLDILVRTSGVKRLSDYMLWQCCENTQIHFSPVYWPDFGLFDMIPILLEYQRKVWSQKAVST